MNLTDLYSTYSRRRKNQTTPRQMLKIVLYSYMNHRYSSREMETSCKRDVNFMYLLEGSPVPDHSTFARFRSIHFAPCSEIIMTEEYIVWLTIGDQPTDTTILIPFIKSMENFLYFKYFKIVADAGYEIEENYVYGKENGQLSYINSANYEI
ncbi:transposase [Clostridium sp.]|uniref:transposase n=1 Tax=Clostridium sp. TaxID=1506 RepID=UPI003216F11F